MPASASSNEWANVRCSVSHAFAEALHKSGLSLLISTYQSGLVFMASARDATKLDLRFRSFTSPMGIAVGPGSLAIGSKHQIWEYQNNPSLSARLEPPHHYDTVFAPSNTKFTGDIRIHEMQYVGDALWFVNTRFSCLATLSREHSFVPQWRPPFISRLAPEGRCHLNGMAIKDGRVAHVTALGTTDTFQGWRENKAHGGVLMEVPSGRIVAQGLSMPHSPRWYQDRLWVLESGKGSLAYLDDRGGIVTVAELSGFTRGLAFVGHYAFVGLSKVRESNVFGGIQLNERVQEKECGVAIVDLRDGRTVAMLRFENGVEEIFDVQLVRSRRLELLETDAELNTSSFILPDDVLADVSF